MTSIDSVVLENRSREYVEARIRAGYEDAMEQGIGDVDAPGLRFGTTAADVEPVAAAG